MMPVFLDLNFLEILLLLQPAENAPLCDKRPEIYDAFIAVGENELKDAMNYWFGGGDSR